MKQLGITVRFAAIAVIVVCSGKLLPMRRVDAPPATELRLPQSPNHDFTSALQLNEGTLTPTMLVMGPDSAYDQDALRAPAAVPDDAQLSAADAPPTPSNPPPDAISIPDAVPTRDGGPGAELSDSEPHEGLVHLRLSQGFQLRALIDYVSLKTGIGFVYDDNVGDRQLNLRAPDAVPATALYDLLGSVLRMEKLAIVDMPGVGWKRIVPADEMQQLSPAQGTLHQPGPAEIETRLFELTHVPPEQVAQMLRPFLTQPGGAATGLTDSRVLVVTDYAHVVENAAGIIRVLDEASGETKTEFYVVQEGDPENLAERVEEVLGGPKQGVALLGDARTRTIVVVADQVKVGAALGLLKQMDRPDASRFQIYRLENMDAERAADLIAHALGFPDSNSIGITPDPESNALIVRGSDKRHEQVAEAIERIDVPVERSSNPIRFYKLQHADALEVFFSLQALQEVSDYQQQSGFAMGVQQATFGLPMGLEGQSNLGFPKTYNPNAGFGQPIQANGMVGNMNNPLINPTLTTPAHVAGNLTSNLGRNVDVNGRTDPGAERLKRLATLNQTQSRAATLPGGARLAVDIGTNSLIIHATPETQEIYSQLIDSLDIQRPQVMIRATIVALDTSDNFRFGVEVSSGNQAGGTRNLNFSSFGLSELDPTTGALKVSPHLGFNGIVVNPNIADVVVQALARDSRSRVLATPKVLVNDNSTGQLESIASIPFVSVNASDTVATTSLGGSQDAGTIITVTPQINEGGYLKLDFAIEFSTFGAAAAATEGSTPLPPPRQIDRISSSITIPDGHTVIVGGLSRENLTSSYSGLPLLARIPIIRTLTGLTSRDASQTTFFLFLTPTVLRDGDVYQCESPPPRCNQCPECVYRPVFIPRSDKADGPRYECPDSPQLRQTPPAANHQGDPGAWFASPPGSAASEFLPPPAASPHESAAPNPYP